jgi:hypothetical protein
MVLAAVQLPELAGRHKKVASASPAPSPKQQLSTHHVTSTILRCRRQTTRCALHLQALRHNGIVNGLDDILQGCGTMIA